MLRKLILPICIILLLLPACCGPTPPAPTPAFTLIPTITPTPIPTQTLVPTETPIPPLALTIRWPAKVSALQPVPIEVKLVIPPGIGASAKISATVFDPDFVVYQSFTLLPQDGNLYVSDDLLQLPLEPAGGDWYLVVDVESDFVVRGKRYKDFQPEPIPYRDMVGVLPAGVDMLVPKDFVEVAVQGDSTAGGRVWRYKGVDTSPPGEVSTAGEVALWWAPGPLKPLLLNNAVVMLEATYGADTPTVVSTEEIEWQGQTAFLFHETWPGPEGGPGKALVVQGPDYWLYVVRVRALGGKAIPPLPHQVWETFAFVAE